MRYCNISKRLSSHNIEIKTVVAFVETSTVVVTAETITEEVVRDDSSSTEDDIIMVDAEQDIHLFPIGGIN